jgi:hypothetical protein
MKLMRRLKAKMKMPFFARATFRGLWSMEISWRFVDMDGVAGVRFWMVSDGREGRRRWKGL